jgi:hypothetical protein
VDNHVRMQAERTQCRPVSDTSSFPQAESMVGPVFKNLKPNWKSFPIDRLVWLRADTLHGHFTPLPTIDVN